MARPLRVDVESGWYHVCARGIEKRTIFVNVRFYEHFVSLLQAMSERYGIEVHAYCLMKNHYHIIIRTPDANASKAIQWLNVSYAAWFNAKMERVGHVFQGRFKSLLIDNNGAWLLKAVDYLHLNPIRTAALGLSKQGNREESCGTVRVSREAVLQRMELLQKFRWSSYRAYCGYAPSPDWLYTAPVLSRGGGRAEFRRRLQMYVTRGAESDLFESIKGKVAIGSNAFLEKARKLVNTVSIEQPDRKFARRLVAFERIMAIVETESGVRASEFMKRRGDKNRNIVLYLARRRSGLTLKEIGAKAGGMDYRMVGKAVKRCEELMETNGDVRRLAKSCMSSLAIFET